MEKLTSHYKPDTVEIVERFKFFKHMQGEKDGVTEYMTSLRKLAKTCNFGDYLNTALRDQLVCGGLKDTRIQQEQLCKKGLTLETALEKARAMEAVAKEALTLHSGASSAQAAEDGDTHAIRKEEAKCYRCGSAGHLAPGCPHKTKCCDNCNKIGHLACVCRSKKKVKKHKKESRKTHLVDAGSKDSSEEDDNCYSPIHKWDIVVQGTKS